MKIVIIGGGAAGASAAARARRLAPEAEITLIESSSMITHAPCGIPYAISGIVPSYKMLKTYDVSRFTSERRINVLTQATAQTIDVEDRTVKVSVNGRLEKLKWDALIIATGAKPLIPKLEGIEEVSPITLRHPEDVASVKARLEKARKVAVVGGGYIGVEVAEALVELGKETMLFEMMDRLLPASIDREISEILEAGMTSAGVDLHLSEPVRSFARREGKVVLATDKDEYAVDDVVLGIGVKPNVELAVEAGVKLGVTGAVSTNEYMETNVEGVFAAGDLVEKYHLVLRRKSWIPLAPAANKEGQVAGANAVKPGSLRMRGIVGTSVTKFKELYVARTGLSQVEAESNGFKVESTLITARSRAGYYPRGRDVTVKMVVEEKSGRILGVQAVGLDPVVASYADIAALAVERGLSIEDLFLSDLGYMPATAPVWHPLIVAARTLSKGRF
ncbi:MAG: FAD-dependent oxidoreductase [Nitrososphaerota archaeon]|nr:FAD-dependent oxidoreductase [Candidatus Calditenuaceae archaeon]MDW8073023.1 FAD-dependent oxidoreductase [Nitrososphaerota archaeon]